MQHLQPSKKRICLLYGGALVLLLGAALLGLILGSTGIGWMELMEAVFGSDRTTPTARIVWFVRIPRVLGSLLCGAALAVSGAVIQGVLANPLASPGIIGVNSGAGLAVTLCTAGGILGGWRLSLFSFLGAFLAVMLVSVGARRWGASKGTVILMGVAMNAFFGAISDAVVTFSPEIAVMSNDFRMGDFSSVTYAKLIPAAVLILVSLAVLLTLAPSLDVLTLGDDNAKGLGMNTGRMRVVFLLLAALLSGAAVSVAGLLSFVGLLVPHAVRRMSGGRAHLLPLCALFGGGFVTLCDTLSRTVFAPYELPVGMILSFLGAPFFLLILIRRKGGHSRA